MGLIQVGMEIDKGRPNHTLAQVPDQLIIGNRLARRHHSANYAVTDLQMGFHPGFRRC
jgi:hypothetical protein